MLLPGDFTILRKIIVRLTLISVMMAIPAENWKPLDNLPGLDQSSASANGEITPNSSESIKSLTISLKILIGTEHLTSKSPNKSENSVMHSSIVRLRQQLTADSLNIIDRLKGMPPQVNRDTKLAFSVLATAMYMNNANIQRDTIEFIEETSNLSPDDSRTLSILRNISRLPLSTNEFEGTSHTESVANQSITSDEDYRFLSTHLGWFGKLAPVQSKTRSPLAQDLASEAVNSAIYCLAAIGLLCVIIILAVVAFSIMSLLLLLRKINFKYQHGPVTGEIALETFTIYLSSMYLLGKILPKFQISFEPFTTKLALNGLFICSLVVVSYWPKVKGFSAKEIYKSFGLCNPKSYSKEAMTALFTYLSMWPLLIVSLLLTLLICTIFHISPNSGTHPIVPFLVSTSSPLVIALTFLLAAVIAPITEEVFFRGVFYHHLRSSFSVLSSIFVSGFIFALVHPQGPIGLLPLTTIGCVLAFLREWRGTLVAPIIMHSLVNSVTLFLALTLMS